MYYIQRRSINHNYLETMDEFESHKEAKPRCTSINSATIQLTITSAHVAAKHGGNHD
jgi:hypothetical protein